MSTQDQIASVLAQWKGKRIRSTDITLEQAAESIQGKEPIVVSRPGTMRGKWILSRTDNSKVAVLTYVGVLAWCGELDTGNLVPQGFEPPERIAEGRIQPVPNNKCEISFCFDTFVDPTLYDNLQVLEANATSERGFNKNNKPRGKWQNGAHPSTRDRYIVSSKLFAKKRAGTINVPYTLHPWITQAVNNQSEYMANPERVQFYDNADGIIRKLEDSANPSLQKNDIVLMTFRLGFNIGPTYWVPEIFPIELVRLDRIQDGVEGTGINAPLYPPLDSEFTPIEAGVPLALLGPSTNTVQAGKRMREQSEEGEGDSIDQLYPHKKQVAGGAMADITAASANVGGSYWALRSMGKGKENRSPMSSK